MSAVEPPDAEIEHSSKETPQEIGDLKLCRQLIDLGKFLDHFCHQSDQKQQPQEAKEIVLEAKKDHGPEEVDDELGCVCPQGLFFLWIVAFPDAGRTDTH